MPAISRYLFAVLFLLAASVSWAQFPAVSFVPVAGGFALPVFVTNAGDGSGRLFVIEQRGTVRVISNGSVLPGPFLDITDRVLSGGERGLLGLAFPPQFQTKQYFYVNYTRTPDGATVISRYHVSNDQNMADPNSEEILLVISQPFTNHNGGMIAFSPVDDYLYIGMGDGGGSGDPNNYAQRVLPQPDRRELLGKMLRIDVESGVMPYAIPPTNPVFFGGLQSEIWSRGLRNPWRFSFDRLTGNLYIGDVGQGRREEIDFSPASSPGKENYGWRVLEGSLCFDPPTGCVPPPNYVPPVFQYSHLTGCSVTGGYVYRGAEFPNLRGIYFFGDFCSGLVFGMRRTSAGFETRLLADTAFAISTFGEGEDGSVYVSDRSTGNIYRILQSVTLRRPNGGQTIPAGSRRRIEWSAAPGISTFAIHFSTDNGMSWRLIARGVSGSGILWNVPQFTVPQTNCRVRVIGLDASGREAGRDMSDRVFTIAP